ncbi:hypothetical protein FRC0190_00632 [Corynebacterium rouxii]|uniref:Cell-surface hemin receptor n=3 Tax=Corynebacterium rouxii TaxID=2719119 RepID=A0A6I8M9U7_9CORY|nr:hypothetical protein FRC0190_00632 [Corynebacterium rouxii]
MYRLHLPNFLVQLPIKLLKEAMNPQSTSAFQSLYPDINPAHSLPLTTWERISMALAVGILSFGVTFGDLIIAGAGLGLVLFAIIAPSQKTSRKIRTEAKNRFPNEPWAETHHNANATIIAMALCWLVIIGINLATLWWAPPSQTTYLAAGVSILSAIIVWFLPGAHPLWNRRRIASHKQQPTGRRRQASKRSSHPQTAEFSQQQ